MKPTITGQRELMAALARMAREVKGPASLQRGGEVILDLAKARAPVLTGEFRDSLAMETREGEVIVGSRLSGGKPWAIEYGTADTAAQPTMRSAVDTGGERAVGAIGEAIGKIVDVTW